MSRNRVVARVRTNEDYKALSRHLDGLGLRYRVDYPGGRTSGHPALFIALPTGPEVPFIIAGTPRGYIDVAARVHKLKKFLREHGIMC